MNTGATLEIIEKDSEHELRLYSTRIGTVVTSPYWGLWQKSAADALVTEWRMSDLGEIQTVCSIPAGITFRMDDAGTAGNIKLIFISQGSSTGEHQGLADNIGFLWDRDEEIPLQIAEKLEKLANLPENWDSYGAPPISPSAVAKVRTLLRRAFSRYGRRLPMPSIAPGSHGGLGIEWWAKDGNELILDVPPEEPPTYLLVLALGEGIEEEDEGTLESLNMLDELLARVIG
jgi:hypothetical protein